MAAEATAVSIVTIHVAKSGKWTTKSDRDDQAMKAIIASYEIPNLINPSVSRYSGPQISLHFRNISVVAKYVDENGFELGSQGDQEADIVSLAVESVVKHLHKADCVQKNSVTFQSRRGHYETRDAIISPLSIISLNPAQNPTTIEALQKGIVSHTYAYMSERTASIFLNVSTPETLQKIDTVLAAILPRMAADANS